ncbi:hypothetical protein DYBT9623_05150 [Dyadobacter sp. CECT 9623]|uniref:Lipoprotein n=1 Tax=Dyadobacter linearis TaxID=2823330 RepID=A0ABM8UXR6_9BACT|nr:hypothetical protein [Dyadobacter sp. CECT 9623]CAG5074463.1 hypothetical protein DYBT9623_05150 [Dyadobacter sp. CECT 9623]
MKKFITVFCFCTILTSCVKNASLTITKNYPERPKGCNVDIYIDKDDIKRQYETICIIDTKTGKAAFERKRLNHVIDLARPLACEAGADALLLMAAGRTDGNGALDIGGSSNGIFKGIKYTDGGPAPQNNVRQKPQTQMEKYYDAKRAKEQAKKDNIKPIVATPNKKSEKINQPTSQETKKEGF